MTAPNLRERVAKAICTVDEQDGGGPWEYYLGRNNDVIAAYYEKADTAIAIVLEEAAKVADSYEPRCDICPSGVTAAIRALKEKNDE